MRALLLAAAIFAVLVGPPARADDGAGGAEPAGLHHRSLAMLYAELAARRPHAPSPILSVQASGPVSCTQAPATCCCKHGPVTQKSWFCTSESDCEGTWSGVCVQRFEPDTMSEANNNHCNQ
ncbi:MAG TPA: hypothetical protein VGG57_03985 [Stellaceae bacterium]|jgi:hypothetical protein